MLPRLLLLVCAINLMSLSALAQIASVGHGVGGGALSRGSLAVAKGAHLATETVAVALPEAATTLGGVTVTLDGVPCRIYAVSPEEIRFVVADEIPYPRVERRWPGWWYIYPQILRVSGPMTFEYRLNLTDTSPWWIRHDGALFGVAVGEAGATTVFHGGKIPVIAGAKIQLRGSGLRSFRPPEWVFYKVLLYDGENLLETEAEVFRDTLAPGVDIVQFAAPSEWKGKAGWLWLQTPSAFSDPAWATFE